jgi:hypothetical protein
MVALYAIFTPKFAREDVWKEKVGPGSYEICSDNLTN